MSNRVKACSGNSDSAVTRAVHCSKKKIFQLITTHCWLQQNCCSLNGPLEYESNLCYQFRHQRSFVQKTDTQVDLLKTRQVFRLSSDTINLEKTMIIICMTWDWIIISGKKSSALFVILATPQGDLLLVPVF